jgi:hypothetical protein
MQNKRRHRSPYQQFVSDKDKPAKYENLPEKKGKSLFFRSKTSGLPESFTYCSRKGKKQKNISEGVSLKTVTS